MFTPKENKPIRIILIVIKQIFYYTQNIVTINVIQFSNL